MAELELGVVVLTQLVGTFLNMRSVCLLRLKKRSGVSAMRSTGLTFSRCFTTGQMSVTFSECFREVPEKLVLDACSAALMALLMSNRMTSRF
jgi:hypothetical protein